LKCILNKYGVGVTQDRIQWRELVNTAMNLRFPWNADIFWSNWVTTSLSSGLTRRMTIRIAEIQQALNWILN